jgi:predicted HTH domain antitoxin
MDEELVARIDAFAAGRYEDRSTALRQLADFALRELTLRKTLDAYRAGRVTLRELARTLGLDIWAAHDLLRAHGVAVAQGDRAETAADLAAMVQEAAGPQA